MIASLFRLLFAAALGSLVLPSGADAAETAVAVAANFTAPAKEIAAAFEKATGNHIVLSFGATGQFATQIRQGAPFAVLLAADAETPKRLTDEGLGVAGTTFTYAIGRLVLWSRDPARAVDAEALKAGAFDKLAIADPKIAPYGAAGVTVLKKLGVYEVVAPKLVVGNSISQAFGFVQTGNAELGFVALSQVIAGAGGKSWQVPADLYDPILQDAVLLKAGAADPAASTFLAFLKGPGASAVIARYGYGGGH